MTNEEMKTAYFNLRMHNVPPLAAEAAIKREFVLLFADNPMISKDFEEEFLGKVKDGEIEIKEIEEESESEVDSEERPKLGL